MENIRETLNYTVEVRDAWAGSSVKRPSLLPETIPTVIVFIDVKFIYIIYDFRYFKALFSFVLKTFIFFSINDLLDYVLYLGILFIYYESNCTDFFLNWNTFRFLFVLRLCLPNYFLFKINAIFGKYCKLLTLCVA